MRRIAWIKSVILRHGLKLSATYLIRFLMLHGFAATCGMIIRGKAYLWSSFLKHHTLWFKRNETHLQNVTRERPFFKPCVVIIGTLDLPQCKKYRIQQKAEQLSMMGIESIVSNVYDIPRSTSALQIASAVILYRLSTSKYADHYIKEARRLSLPIVYDIDDPIFNRKIYENNRNLDFLEHSEKRHLLESTSGYLSILKQCDSVIVSTPKMRQVASQCFDGPIFLWRNVADSETCHLISNLNTAFDENFPYVSLSYMSGSRAHESDFEQIINPLLKIMQEFPMVRLIIGGHARLPRQFDAYKERIITMPFMDFRGYLKFLSKTDINLVPLVQDEFNDCKSAIRFLEAAMMGKPTIATNIGDFTNIISNGESGYLVENEEEWYEKIKCLVESKMLRERIGMNARQYVIAEQSNEHIVRNIDVQLQKMLLGFNEQTTLNN